MSKINLKNFVNIDIQPTEVTEVRGTRGIVTIFTNYNITAITTPITVKTFTKIMTNDNSPVEAVNLNIFLDTYFKLGGDKAVVIPIEAKGSSVTATELKTAIVELDNENILIAYIDSADTATTGNYSLMKSLAGLMNADINIYGINEKIIITRDVGDFDYSYEPDKDKVKNLAVKYSSHIGGEASIAAYLSQIDVYSIDSVKDYMFTNESNGMEAEDVSDVNYNSLITNNYNVDIDLQGNVRVCGGNCKDGDSLSNNFIRIVLHQTLTSRLVSLLATKISGSNGVGKIYATLIDELGYYKANGYLSTEKVWTKDDLIVNGVKVIEKGTPLVDGYYIKVFPVTSTVISTKSAPPIYIIIADQYSIRVINIVGEVI